MLLIILILIGIIFTIKQKEEESFENDILILPDNLERFQKLSSRKFLLPIKTNSNRTIKILMDIIYEEDEKEKREEIEHYVTADDYGNILFDSLTLYAKESYFYIFLDPNENNKLKSNTYFNVEFPDEKEDVLIELLEKVNDDKNYFNIFNNTQKNVQINEETLEIDFVNNVKLDKTLKDFIKFSIIDESFRLNLYQKTKKLNEEINILHNGKMIAKTKNNKINYLT